MAFYIKAKKFARVNSFHHILPPCLGPNFYLQLFAFIVFSLHSAQGPFTRSESLLCIEEVLGLRRKVLGTATLSQVPRLDIKDVSGG